MKFGNVVNVCTTLYQILDLISERKWQRPSEARTSIF